MYIDIKIQFSMSLVMRKRSLFQYNLMTCLIMGCIFYVDHTVSMIACLNCIFQLDSVNAYADPNL